MSALIGDDIDSVCQLTTKQVNIPVIYVNAPGLLGSKNLGNRIGNETLLNAVIGTAEPEFTTPFDINIVGDYNVAGETWNILPLFQKMGIRVLSKITGDARYQEVCYAHRAKLNKVLHQTKADVLITGAGNKYTALKTGIPFLDINYERHHAYAGYAGLVVLARELHEALYSPIWEQISKPAPWDEKISYQL